MRENYNLRWVEDDPLPNVEPRKLTSAERVAAQRQANAQESERAWAHVQSEESQKRYAEQRKETLDKRKRFAKSLLIPDLSADVGTKVEPISNIFGKYAAFSIPIDAAPSLPTLGEIGVWLTKMAGTAFTEFEGLAMRAVTTSPYAAVAVAIAYVPKSADGTIYDNSEIYDLKSLKTNVRLGVSPSGLITYGFHVDGTPIDTKSVDKVGEKLVVTLEEGLTIEWVPITEEDAGRNILVSPIPKAIEQHTIYVHPKADQGTTQSGVYIKTIAESSLRDLILTFPPETAIPPIYIVYSSPRYMKGTASGKGKDVKWEDGYWLGEASNTGDGQFIPTAVAKALEGQEFQNFSEYQSAFWIEVANWIKNSDDEQLKAQFSRTNLLFMARGNAPFVGDEDYEWGEKLKRYVLHHKIQIQHNGDVYNADNIRVATPGLHWGEIHGSKRVGKKGNVLKNEK